MDILEVFRSAIDSLQINKLRSALTALGIIIGVAAIILLISIGSGLQNYISGEFEKLGTNSIFILPGKVRVGPQGGPPQAINKLTFKTAQALERSKGPFISEVLPQIEQNVTASFKNKTEITLLVGTNAAYFGLSDIKASQGRVFSKQDDQAAKKVAVIGNTLAEKLYESQNPVGQKISISKKPFTVIGVMASQGNAGGVDIDNQIIIPIQTARVISGADQVNSILVRTTSAETIPQAKAQVEKVLGRSLSEDDFTILTQEQLLSSILQILGVLTLALGGIAGISLIVGGVGISNIMLVSVTERTREIGLRKAVGAKPRDILNQFLIEAVILSLFGGIVGLLIGFAGSLALAPFIKTAVPFWAVALGIGFSSAVGIVFGVAPAIRASRLEPIVALRHE
ncbi:MAG: ABC transporter permease [Candidatus Curtissbacteria bacterium]